MPDSPTKTAAEPRAAAEEQAVAAPGQLAEAGPAPAKPRSLGADAWADLRRKPMFVASAVIILLLIVMAAFPSWFTSTDPGAGDLRNHFLGSPNLTHLFQDDWFGYDKQGRSIYARVVYGAQVSVLVGIGVTLLCVVLGGLIGMLAGYFGGFLDTILSRVTDIFFGIPFILGAMVVLNAFTDRNVWTVIGALAFLGWTAIARVMRGAVITTKHADYVMAAKALGAGTGRILMRHILPNAIAPVIVVATINLGAYIVTEATLSFLGMGLGTDVVSWGADISDATESVRNSPHVLLFPAGMLSLTVLAFIMLGDAVREALDPKLR